MKLSPQQVVQRFENMKSQRGVWETHWQDLADYNLPMKDQFNRKNVRGEKKGIELYDSTAMVSCDLLSSALHGMLTNPNSLWFLLSTTDEQLNSNEQVIEYLQELTRRAHNIMNLSNFQTEVHEFYLDLCCFGTATMTVEEDEDAIVRFSTKHLSNIFIKENAFGVVDQVYRRFSFTAHQVVEKFRPQLLGASEKELEKELGPRIAKSFINNSEEEFEIVHAVYRDFEDKSSRPFKSDYVLISDKVLLSEGRFKRFPYIVSRWTKLSGEVYGRSPAMNALPESKTLNIMAKTVLKGAQKVVDPPMQMPDDGFVRPLRTAPASINYYRAGTQDLVKPIFNDTRIDFGFQALEAHQNKVRQAFYIDRLNLQNNDRMTTVEVNQRVQEQLRFMGPMLGRQQTEFLRPLNDLVLDMMIDRDRDGDVIGNPPPEIAEVNLDIKYTSPVARAQRVSEADAMQQALAASGPMFELDPNAVDVIDAEKIVRENFAIFGAPQKVLRKQAEVEAIREAKQQAQEAALQQQQQLQESEVVKNVAPAIQNQGQV